MKLTICAYDSLANVGGPTTWLANLTPKLSNFGIELEVLLLCWDSVGPLFESLQESGVSVAISPCAGYTEDRVKWLLDRVAKNTPDVFVPNLVTPAFLASQYVRTWGIPTVGVLHSDDRFYNAVSDAFVYGRKKDALSAVVCVSEYIKQQMLARPTQRTIVSRIPYGIAPPSERCQRNNKAIKIAYVGRFAEEQKRISDVVRALCLATKLIPGTEAALFGDGPDRNKVESLIKSSSSEDRVKIVGRVENSLIPKVLQDFDAILLLSDYEGLPIALLEGMACGAVPIVTKMQSGIPELIQDNVNGIVVNDREMAVVSAVEKLTKDSSFRQRLSRKASETIRNHYSLDRHAELWVELLRSLHASAPPKKNIVIPQRFDFPRVHKDLAAEDLRKPTLSYPSKARAFLGRLRRQLFGLSLKQS